MSSTTPGRVVNSCCAPWTLICVIELPSRLDSKIRRSPLPIVDTEATLERLGDELAVGGGEGLVIAGDETRQLQPAPSNMHSCLRLPDDNRTRGRSPRRAHYSGTKFDNQLGLHRDRDVLGLGMRSTRPSGIAPSAMPRKSGTVAAVFGQIGLHQLQALGTILHANQVARLHDVAGDVHDDGR